MTNTLLAVVAAIACVSGSPAQTVQPDAKPWKPVEGGLMTRWAKDVKPDAPLPEYPRPTMVREKWMNLNGLWEYHITPKRGSGIPEADEPRGNVLVPFPLESALSGVKRHLAAGERLEYRRSFEIPADWAGSNVLLHFGAANWEYVVKVNGHTIATHSGGYDPVSYDITKALKPGANTLEVAVWNPGNGGGQPRGKQFDTSHAIWYTASSGIWQTVWLEPVPKQSIQQLSINANRVTGEVSIDVQDRPKPGLGDLQYVAVVSRNGKALEEVRSRGPKIVVQVDKPDQWSPDSPALYDITVRTEDTTGVVDEVKSYFAFRDVGLGKDDHGFTRLLLNGKPIFHYGPLDQGYWPDGLYTAPTDEALKSDIIAAKRMGCNMIRKHVKVEPERWYYWCDKLGVMVWQDMPSAFFKTKHFDEGFPELSDKWKANFEKELKAMIDARRHHPSIVMWVPWNEGWGQQDMDWSRTVAESVKKMDPTRLVNNATGWTDMGVGDTRDIHAYPEPAMVPIERDDKGRLWGGRAAVLGEFGGLGLPLAGHTWVTKDNWGYRTYETKDAVTDAYVGMMQQMPALIAQGLCAAVYTQTTDVEIECNGWMTYDREVWKIDPEKAKAATMPMYGTPPVFKTLVPIAQAPKAEPASEREWAFTFTKPDDHWIKPETSVASWKKGIGGFGTKGTPGAIIGTAWDTSDIWIRSDIQLNEVPASPYLNIHHDEDAEVWINGELAATLKDYTSAYQLVKLPKAAAALLKNGTNTIAIHCHQTKGGQYIDCGLVDVVPAP